ncbi:MAG: dihydrolipoyl dehydrogenase [Myxococcota bacterium]|nr:dihydrolipoyl dehydrogenase [Myxococcota bacterium]MDW8363714.1 dihydrolipoyl dehydrogenase [Myxococcales bacterium]
MTERFDLVVVGAGTGGYPAAIRGAQLGLSTLCVEKEYLGGVCLNWGCIPSKALIAATGLLERIRHASEMGIRVQGLEVDVAAMQAWKAGIVRKLTGGIAQLFRANGVQHRMGIARLRSPRSVEITAADGTRSLVEATRGIIVATGAAPIVLPGFEVDGRTVITAREAVSLERAPGSMVIIGGGVIGLELGMVYQKLGTRVTVVELTSSLLPGVDPDLVRVVERRLKRAGAEVLLEARARGLERTGDRAEVVVEHAGAERRLPCDVVLLAVGFRPQSRGLGLEELGVRLDERGHVRTDELLRTNVPGIWATGDVSGPPYLAHKATKEAEIAAEVIAGHKSARDWVAMPAAIFTEPEIATVGLSEAEARAQGRRVRVGRFPFAASGRALALGDSDGLVKVVVDEEDHRVLGVGIVGPEAADLIGEASLALEMGACAEDVALTVHPHPTLGEGVMEAFKHALGEAVHVLNK